MTDRLLNIESEYHEKNRIVSDVWKTLSNFTKEQSMGTVKNVCFPCTFSNTQHAQNSAELLKAFGAKLKKPCVLSISDGISSKGLNSSEYVCADSHFIWHLFLRPDCKGVFFIHLAWSM